MYKSTSRVFSYEITYEEMKEFLEKRGYTIITAIQALKKFDKDIMKLVRSKCGDCLSGLNYSFAYKEDEKEQFFFKFSNLVKELYNNDDISGEQFFYDKYFWLNQGKLYNDIVDIKVMSIIRDEFKINILENNDNER